ncbi:hypothetical protein [Acetobacterium bakii]|nr:hypothetical protein [Acetobacterium bakii]
MNELVFKNTLEFADWSSGKEIFNMEYLGSLDGHKSQNCFEVDIEKNGVYLIGIEKSEKELFFKSAEDLSKWTEVNKVADLINNGLSDIYVGFNQFDCLKDGQEIRIYIDSVACSL